MSAQRIAVSARTIVDGCFDAAGTAELETVYDVGLALGVPEQTVRLAIRRMQAAGELRQIGRGRSGRLERTASGAANARRDEELVSFAFAQDAGDFPWDGRWRLAAFSAPESERRERDAIRTCLTALGAVSIAAGLYVSPHDLVDDLNAALSVDVVARRVTTASTTDLVIPGCAGPMDIAERLWPAATTRSAYTPLVAELDAFDSTDRETLSEWSEVEVLAWSLRLSEGLDRALRVDPLLPGELRAGPWEPAAVRSRLVAAWTALERLAPTLPVFRAP